jgi:ABC-type dipeptide/oligopeptide/nickel transport system ATPase subunit
VHPIDQAGLPPEIVRVSGLKKVYKSGQTDLVLFENLSFQVRKGEMLAIVGESGAGKSSLLHILGALDRASAGDVYCAQIPVACHRLCLAVSLPVAGIYGAGECCNAALDARNRIP